MPELDTLRLIAGAVSAKETAITLGAAALAAFAGGSLLAPAVRRALFPEPIKTSLAEFLHFDRVLEDGRTIRLKDGGLVRTIEIMGADMGALTRQERETLFQRRKFWFDTLGDTADLGVEVRIIVSRAKVPLTLDLRFDSELLQTVSDKWHRDFADSYRNRQFLVLSVPGSSQRARARLNDATLQAVESLDPFRPVVLGHDAPEFSPLLTAWSDLLNPHHAGAVGSFSDDIAARLVASRVHFARDGLITFTHGVGESRSYATALGISKWGDVIGEDLATELLSIDAELTIVHQLKPYSPVNAEIRLRKNMDFMLSIRDSPGIKQQFNVALEAVEAGADTRQAAIDHQMTIFVHAISRAELDERVSLVRKKVNNFGIRTVAEGLRTQQLWFSIFPGNRRLVRPCLLFSQHMAEIATFETAAQGHFRSDWGEGPIRMLRTSTGAPYAFQFHDGPDKEELGHMVLIGPTGAGKTMFMTWLMAGARRIPNLRTYTFDRHLGAYVYTTATGGAYLAVQSEIPGVAACQLNPCHLDLTEENQAFLQRWMRLITGCADADSAEMIARAVRSLAIIPERQRRSLRAVFDEAFDQHSPVRKEMRRWVENKQYGTVFNGPKDTLDLAGNAHVAFDMTRVFDDDLLTRAIVSYLLHRIFETLAHDASPALIFIDETKPMLAHEMFRREVFEVLLQEGRKKRVVVVSAFQRPQAIVEAGMGEVVRANVPTQIFFRNPNAKREDYEGWRLTDREWAFITGQLASAQHLPRAVLVKRASGESVVLDVNLNKLGPWREIFRSGSEFVQRAQACQKTYSRSWVVHYLED